MQLSEMSRQAGEKAYIIKSAPSLKDYTENHRGVKLAPIWRKAIVLHEMCRTVHCRRLNLVSLRLAALRPC